MQHLHAWHEQILATHEEAQETSFGPWPGHEFPGVALPSPSALRRWVLIQTISGIWTFAQVRDVGPWCVDDDAYVSTLDRPRAEKYKGKACPLHLPSGDSALNVAKALATLPNGTECPICNGAGIDLFPATARALQIPLNENVLVHWRFVCLNDVP